jgi:DNA modification methylase
MTIHPYDGQEGGDASATGTSIFDPVLCELAYRWFSGEGAQVLDPFAGGSVRGIVASHLGRRYWGCDLRAEQIEANRIQGAALCDGKPQPEWVCGDSMNEVEKAPAADFIFSCPPYGDLEQYSELSEDLSAMEWPAFRLAYRAIIVKACQRLRSDRFACFVVGDFRDGKGNYRNFVSETIAAFLDAGLSLYNEAILITSVGSASMRVTRQFNAGRKLCKTHQNVLVFVKGDGRKAADEAMRGEAGKA